MDEAEVRKEGEWEESDDDGGVLIIPHISREVPATDLHTVSWGTPVVVSVCLWIPKGAGGVDSDQNRLTAPDFFFYLSVIFLSLLSPLD